MSKKRILPKKEIDRILEEESPVDSMVTFDNQGAILIGDPRQENIDRGGQKRKKKISF